MPPTPPRKKPGDQKGPRRFDGELLDVVGAAALLGTSEKCVRARIARGVLPYRRDGGRVVLLRRELLGFLDALPGVTTAQALANIKKREGQPA